MDFGLVPCTIVPVGSIARSLILDVCTASESKNSVSEAHSRIVIAKCDRKKRPRSKRHFDPDLIYK